MLISRLLCASLDLGSYFKNKIKFMIYLFCVDFFKQREDISENFITTLRCKHLHVK